MLQSGAALEGCFKEQGVNLTPPPGQRRHSPEQELIEEHVSYLLFLFEVSLLLSLARENDCLNVMKTS